MSYILEALKRSERQRLGPGGLAQRTIPVYAYAARQPSLLLYGAAGAVLIVAGAVIGWLRPWQHSDAAAAPAPVAAAALEMVPDPAPEQKAPAAAAQPAPVRQAEPPRPETERPETERMEKVEELRIMQVKPHRPARAHAETPVAPAAPPVAQTAAPPAPVVAARPAAPAPAPAMPQAAQVPVASPAQAPQAQSIPPAQAAAPEKETGAPGATPAPPPGEGKILALHELPPEVLRAIPAMAITGYSYSETPRDRMVGINDRLVQEGQYVADGLKLEQITPDGLIFSYKNYRFLKKLQ